MKHLFSPWRSAYIETFKHKKGHGGCLFCRIAKQKKDAQNLVAWRGKTCFVVLNRFPYNSGHVMVVPYRHLPSFGRLHPEEFTEVMEATSRCIQALDAMSVPHGYNFGANLGRVAGAGIADHIHFHLVPRWNGDTNFMPVLAETKLISERLEDLCRSLRQALNPPARRKKAGTRKQH
jgi:ATP adenylyltransferase